MISKVFTKVSKPVLFFVLISIISTIAFFSVSASKQEKIEKEKRIEEKLTKTTENKSGKLIKKGTEVTGNFIRGTRNKTLFEDDGFEYTIDDETESITTVRPKRNSPTYKSKKPVQVSEVALKNEALKIAQKYAPVSDKCKYVFTSFIAEKDNGISNMITLEEITNSGVKTGTNIMVIFDKDGYFSDFSHIKSNAEVALTKTPQITKDDALKKAIEIVNSEVSNIKIIPKDNTELSGLGDKLVWIVKIDNILDHSGNSYNYKIFIDAINGKVIDKVYTYCPMP